jgi:ribose 5-phosphate isomerase RpiB
LIGTALAQELIETFTSAHFSGDSRHQRLAEVLVLQHKET